VAAKINAFCGWTIDAETLVQMARLLNGEKVAER
jgi:hypothetical protein